MTGGDTPVHGRPANAHAEEAEAEGIRVDACLSVDLW
jgi:hypothetical protein